MSVFSLPIFVHQWRDPNYETFRQSFQKIADQVALPADDNIELIRTGFHGGADHSFYKGNTGNGGEGLAVAFLPQSAAMASRDNQTLHPIASVAINRTLCHPERFIVGEPFWWMFAEDGPMALSICLPVHGSMPLSRTGWNRSPHRP